MSNIIIDNVEREIDYDFLNKLAEKFLPELSNEDREKFIDEINFRLSDIEFESEFEFGYLFEGRVFEEYYFAAFLDYYNDNGKDLDILLGEMDDIEIWNHCGVYIPDAKYSLKLTEKGNAIFDKYISDCWEERNSIIKAGLDNGDKVCIPDKKYIMSTLFLLDFDNEGHYYEQFYVTNHYKSKDFLNLWLGVDVIDCVDLD